MGFCTGSMGMAASPTCAAPSHASSSPSRMASAEMARAPANELFPCVMYAGRGVWWRVGWSGSICARGRRPLAGKAWDRQDPPHPPTTTHLTAMSSVTKRSSLATVMLGMTTTCAMSPWQASCQRHKVLVGGALEHDGGGQLVQAGHRPAPAWTGAGARWAVHVLAQALVALAREGVPHVDGGVPVARPHDGGVAGVQVLHVWEGGAAGMGRVVFRVCKGEGRGDSASGVLRNQGKAPEAPRPVDNSI